MDGCVVDGAVLDEEFSFDPPVVVDEAREVEFDAVELEPPHAPAIKANAPIRTTMSFRHGSLLRPNLHSTTGKGRRIGATPHSDAAGHLQQMATTKADPLGPAFATQSSEPRFSSRSRG
jgi:hypothetical protein